MIRAQRTLPQTLDFSAVRRILLCALAATMLLLPSGCVRRRLNVRTNPPGALVYVDNQLIGTTPCGVDFTYYGTREIRLVKPGYESLAINQPIPTPWYECPPIDFVSENLWPSKIRDDRTVVYDLRPQVVVPPHVIVEHGEQLRRDANAAGPPAGTIVTPPGVVVPPGTIIAPPANTLPPAGAFAPPAGTIISPPTTISPAPGSFAPLPSMIVPPPGPVSPLPSATAPVGSSIGPPPGVYIPQQ